MLQRDRSGVDADTRGHIDEAVSAVQQLCAAARHREHRLTAEIASLRMLAAKHEASAKQHGAEVQELRRQNAILMTALRNEHAHLAHGSLFGSLEAAANGALALARPHRRRQAAGGADSGEAAAPRAPRKAKASTSGQGEGGIPSADVAGFPVDIASIIAESNLSPVVQAACSEGGGGEAGRMAALYKHICRAEEALRESLQLRHVSRSAVSSGVRRAVRTASEGAPKRGLRVLTLDGGGARGMIMVEALRKLEFETGRRVHEMFDLVVGTSSGGLLGALLAAKRASLAQAADAYEAIRVSLCQIGPAWQNVRRLAVGTSHDTEVARRMIVELFGEGRMSDFPATPKVAVLATNVEHAPATAHVFRSYPLPEGASCVPGSSTATMAQAIRATTCAPTYYEPEVIDGKHYVDGGVTANNPTMVALSEARALWPDTPIDVLVSIGSGAPSRVPARPGSLLEWMQVVMGAALSNHTPHCLAGTLLGPQAYHRLDGEGLGDYNITEGDPATLRRMIRQAQQWVCSHHEHFARVADILRPDRPRKGASCPTVWPPAGDFRHPVVARSLRGAVQAGAKTDSAEAPPGILCSRRPAGRGRKRPRAGGLDGELTSSVGESSVASWVQHVPVLGGWLAGTPPAAAESTAGDGGDLQ